jgi:uncharacterized protein involved in exopolysaccharide biosynthesis
MPATLQRSRPTGGKVMQMWSHKMKLPKLFLPAIVLLVGTAAAQTNVAKVKPTPSSSAVVAGGDVQTVQSSPAYAELLLHQTELQSTIDGLLVDYTEEFPKIKEIRVELGFLRTEMLRLLAVKPAGAGRLTLALGRLMLKKVELERQLDVLRSQYKDEHPEVRKTRRQIETYESAIKEILG